MAEAPRHLLLTGGTGFFGRALLRRWIEGGDAMLVPARVTVVSRSPDRFRQAHPDLCAMPGLELVAGDICDAASLPKGRAFTHVIHAAADSTLGPQLSPLQRFDQILEGTRNVLELAVQSGARRLLFTSSGAVYGAPPPGLVKIPESWRGMPDPLDPANAYGVAKRSAEHLCVLHARPGGLQVVIARCFAFVGPDLPLDVHFAIGNFIRDALWSERIVVGGDGSPLRSYLYQSDLAHWLMELLMRGEGSQAYNVGSDEAISVLELAHLVRDTLAPCKPVEILGAASQGLYQRNTYIPDITKAQEALAVRVSVPLRDAIIAAARGIKGAD